MNTWYSKVDDIIKVNAEIKALERWRNNLTQDILESLSPVKVGDHVSVETDGYKNLKRGYPMVVVKVVYRGLLEDRKEVMFEAIGDILRKDGTVSQFRGRHLYLVQYADKA